VRASAGVAPAFDSKQGERPPHAGRWARGNCAGCVGWTGCRRFRRTSPASAATNT